ncbi:serine hydrolase domain-containing protein [Bacillus cereus]|uniref:serine hydrolase domain-containing protein n=1 Tax=Bacillus cereus TaxID=1396 RepID=UPI000B4BB5FE|nr:serine hydrolase [Bacillus cereus]
MKNRQKASIICKSILCLIMCILITNEAWFTNVVRAESGILTDRSIEDFKKKLDEQVPKWQENYEVPGVAIGIVHEGRIAYTLNYGYVDKKAKKAVSDDTLFQAGSISKNLTAWGILHLVDEGRLLLDDPVGKYLTKWKLPNSEFNNNEVTIRRLLSHTAGLSAHKGYLGVAPGKHLDSIQQSLSGKGWLNEAVEVTNKPGSETIYSGGGYTILQLVIEEVTGIPFDRYMEEQIMKPLGMKSSSFLQRPENHNLSKAYGYFGEELPSYQFTEQAAAGLKTNVIDMMTLILASMDANNKGNGVIKSERKDGLVILTNGDGGIDLRQDIYHVWIEYETGNLPESYFSLAEQRKTNFITSIVIGATLSIYLLLFVIRLYKGRRTFIFKQEKKSYIGLVVRTFLLVVTAVVIFCAAYLWRVFSLNSGNTINFILIMVWIITLLINGFFPKIKSNKKQRMKRKDLTSKFTCM